MHAIEQQDIEAHDGRFRGHLDGDNRQGLGVRSLHTPCIRPARAVPNSLLTFAGKW